MFLVPQDVKDGEIRCPLPNPRLAPRFSNLKDAANRLEKP